MMFSFTINTLRILLGEFPYCYMLSGFAVGVAQIIVVRVCTRCSNEHVTTRCENTHEYHCIFFV